MRAFTSQVKRCLALLLAVLMMVPAVAVHSHAEEPGNATHVLSKVIVSNYGDKLSAEEKAILGSGVLLGDKGFYGEDFPVLGEDLVDLNSTSKKIAAATSGDGAYKWVPVTAIIKAVDGSVVEKIQFNGKTEVGYTYTGSQFSVEVTYALNVNVAAADQLALLNAASELYQDILIINQLTEKCDELKLGGMGPFTVNEVLDALTNPDVGASMGLETSIIDALAELVENGVNEEVPLPSGKQQITIYPAGAAADAIAAVKNNGNRFALPKFFAEHGGSTLELAMHAAELQAAIDSDRANLQALEAGLSYQSGELKRYLNKINNEWMPEVYATITDVLAEACKSNDALNTHLAAYLNDDGKITEDELEGVIAALNNVDKDIFAGINAELAGYGITDLTVNSIEDLQKVQAYLDGSEAELLEAIQAALDGTGYVLSSLDGISALIGEIETGVADKLEEVEKALDELEGDEYAAIKALELNGSADLETLSLMLAGLRDEKLPELNSALSAAGYDKTVSTAADAAAAKTWLQTELDAALTELNKQLADAGVDAEVTCSADINDELLAKVQAALDAAEADAVAAAHEAIDAEILSQINAELKANDYAEIDSLDEVDTLMADIQAEYSNVLSVVNGTLSAFGYSVSNSAELQALINAYPQIAMMVPGVQDYCNDLAAAEEAMAALESVDGLVEEAYEAADKKIAEEFDSAFATLKVNLETAKETMELAEEGIAAMDTAVALLTNVESKLADLEAAITTVKAVENALVELKKADSLVKNAAKAEAALGTVAEVLSTLESARASLTELQNTEATIDELQVMSGTLDKVIGAFGTVLSSVLTQAVADYVFCTPSKVSSASSSLTANVTALAGAKQYDEGDLKSALELERDSVVVAQDMYTLTVTVQLKDVDPSGNLQLTKTVTKTFALAEGTKGIADMALGYAEDVAAEWGLNEKIYWGGWLEQLEGDTLVADDACTFLYSPYQRTVTFDYVDEGTEVLFYHGASIKLETCPDSSLVFDYFVYDEAEGTTTKYMQGETVVVGFHDLTISLEEGPVYTTAYLYDVIADQLGENELLIKMLNSGAIAVDNETYYVRFPGEGLVNVDDNTMTAADYRSGVGFGEDEVLWHPYAVYVYSDAVTLDETVLFNGANQVELPNSYHHTEVEYKLALEQVDSQEVLDTMNALVQIVEDAKSQIATMEDLVEYGMYITVLSGAMNQFVDPNQNTTEYHANAASKEAIARVNANKYVTTLKKHIDNYDARGLGYYFKNSAEIKSVFQALMEEIVIVAGVPVRDEESGEVVSVVGGDPNLGPFMEINFGTTAAQMGFDLSSNGIAGMVENIAKIADDLVVAHEAILPGNADALAKILEAQDLASIKLTPYDKVTDPSLSATLVQAGVDHVSVTVSITVNDIFGGSSTKSYTHIVNADENGEAVLVDEDVSTILAKVEEFNPSFVEYFTVVGPNGNSYDLDACLAALEAGFKGNQSISYIWTEFCDHFGLYDEADANCISGAICEYCGQEATAKDLSNHNWGADVIVAAACEKAGSGSHTCKDCGLTETWEIPAEPHVWSDWTGNGDETCVSYGTVSQSCSKCGATKTRDADKNDGIELKAHTYGVWYPVSGSDEHEHACSVCGHTETDGHKWDNGKVTQEPDCTIKGQMAYTCSECGQTKTEEIAALGHSYKGETYFAEAGHGHLCVRCDVRGPIEESHTWTEVADHTQIATCKVEGCTYTKAGSDHSFGPWYPVGDVVYGVGYHEHKCTVAGCTVTEQARHEWGEAVVTVAPTCEAAGEQVQTCLHCEATYTTTLAKLSHKWGEWKHNGDGTHTRTCEHNTCASCVQTEACTYAYVSNGDATCTEDGTKTGTCLKCGEVTSEPVPDEGSALGHSFTTYVYNGDGDCVNSGTETAKCDHGCGETHTRPVAGEAPGHAYKLTKLDDQYHANVCEVCGEAEPGSKTTHTYDNTSCTEDGECACGATYDGSSGQHVWVWNGEVGDAEGHTLVCQHGCVDGETGELVTKHADHAYTDKVTKEPTCTEVGTLTHTCDVCGYAYAEEIPALGHAWGEWVAEGETDCTTGGKKTRTCATCGEVEEETVPPTDHTWQYTIVDDEKHIAVCSACGTEEEQAHAWSDEPTRMDGSYAYYACVCGHEKSSLEGSVGDVSVDRQGNVTVDLGDDGGDEKYDIEYTVDLGWYDADGDGVPDTEIVFTITVGEEAEDGSGMIEYDLIEEAIEYFEEEYGIVFNYNSFASFVRAAAKANSIEITPKRVYNKLQNFVRTLNDAAAGAIEFILVETGEGKYTIIANVADPAGLMSVLAPVGQALGLGGYDYIGMESADGTDHKLFSTSTLTLSLQTLVDGLMAQDGFGTERMINAKPYEIEGDILVGNSDDIGSYLQTITMNLGYAADDLEQEDIAFVLTINDSVISGLRPTLIALREYVSIATVGGKLEADLNLPEKVYEVYLAAALFTGDVNKNNVEEVKSWIAFNYMFDYIKAATEEGVTYETFENTVAKVGVNVELKAYETYINYVLDFLRNGDARAELNETDNKIGALDLGLDVGGLLSAAGMSLGGLESLIDEVKYNQKLNIGLAATLREAHYGFQVAVVDINNGSTLDKVDFAENGAGRINKLAGTAAVMLLSDIEGDLVFNHTTILDLNGKTITGSIKANGTLIIVDSAMPNAKLSSRSVPGYGCVNGPVSGNVTILGGCYSDVVTDFLPEGYIVEDGCVRNALYKITSDGTNLYVTLDPTAIPTSSDGLVELAMDIAVDLFLNYYSTASFALDGNEVFGVNLPEILGMVSESDKTELINTLINCIKFDGGLDYFINAITADLLDFGAIAKGEIFSHGITTKAWNLELVYVEAEDYLDFTINSVNTINDFNLNIAIAHDSEWIENLFTLMGDILDAGFVVDFEQPVYAPGSISIGGSANAHANLVLSDTPDYVMAFALLLTYHDAKVADALKGNVDLAYVQDVFNKMTVGQFCEVLKDLHEDVNFTALAKNVGWTYADETVGLNELHLVLTAAGELIDSLRNAAEARDFDLDRIMNAKLSSFLQADGTYAYGVTKSATTGTISGVDYTLGDSSVSVSADIFPEAYSVTYVSDDKTVYTDAAYAGFNYALVDLALTKEGYTFKGWKLDGKTYVAGDTFSFDGDVTLTAVWEKKNVPGPGPDEPEVDTYYVKYSVTNAPAGFKAPATKWYEAGETVTVADQPSVDGYEFYGWYLNGELITTGSFKMPAKNVTLTGWFEGVSDCCHWYHCPSSWYVDLDVNAWYHSATDYVICRGLMIGVQHEPEMLFAPHMATSRAMIVTTLYRLEGSPEVEYTGHYTDVADDLWYSDAIVWATNNGIVEGYGNGIFGPNDYVTREQICTIFFRYANFKGIDTSARADISEFVDADQVSDWALEAVQWDVATGMIRGMSETEKVLSPETDTERVQMATLLMRWCKKFNA